MLISHEDVGLVTPVHISMMLLNLRESVYRKRVHVQPMTRLRAKTLYKVWLPKLEIYQ